MISLRKLAGPGTVSAYAARLGEDARAAISVRRLVNADLMHRRWEAAGGRKVLGTPVGDVGLVAGRYTREYSSGTLTAIGDTVEVQKAYKATVAIAGIKCIKRAETDQVGGPSSEPYLIATAVDTAMEKGEAISKLFGPYEDIDGGDWIGIGVSNDDDPTIWEGANPQNLVIQLLVMEEDGGQQHEVRRKTQTTINDALHVVGVFVPAIGLIFNRLGPVKDRIIRAAANILKELFKDDKVGQNTKSLTYQDFIVAMPPERTVPDGGTKYRGEPIRIDGGKAGIYDIYLWWTITPVTVPPA